MSADAAEWLMFRATLIIVTAILLLAGVKYYQDLNIERKNYPYQAGVDEALKQFPQAKADWLAGLNLAGLKPPNDRPEIVKILDSGEHGNSWYIMYDKTDDLTDAKSLHFGFYKTSIYTSYKSLTLGPSYETLKSIAAVSIGDGYHLVISWAPYKSYQIIKHTEKPFELIKFNCSTFIEPITQSCPDQWAELEQRINTLKLRVLASKYRPQEIQ